jgi:fatty-acyl-CoA synthase
MAALVVSADFRLEQLRAVLAAQLPAYARPVFLRILPALELTGTFKLRKQQLAEEGYDPTQVRDPLYLDDPARAAYVPLDAALYATLASGKLRL